MLGITTVIHAGEFQRLSTGHGILHRERNASHSDAAHIFQNTLRPARMGLEPEYEQKRFCAAERGGALCLVVSPDGRRGSLRVHQDACLYSALLEPGKHVVHALGPKRSAWIHIVSGEVALGHLVLVTGDGAGVEGERSVSLTARRHTEVLLFDLGAADLLGTRREPVDHWLRPTPNVVRVKAGAVTLMGPHTFG